MYLNMQHIYHLMHRNTQSCEGKLTHENKQKKQQLQKQIVTAAGQDTLMGYYDSNSPPTAIGYYG